MQELLTLVPWQNLVVQLCLCEKRPNWTIEKYLPERSLSGRYTRPTAATKFH